MIISQIKEIATLLISLILNIELTNFSVPHKFYRISMKLIAILKILCRSVYPIIVIIFFFLLKFINI